MSDVSILLPVRDAETTLEEALGSLLAQTHRDIEICVHDDGSADGSWTLIQKHAKNDERIRATRGAPQGIVGALQAAAKEASAPWLVRMDADDVSAPNRVEALLRAANAEPDVSFWASEIAYFPRETLSNGMQRYESWINSLHTHDEIVRDRFVECPMPHPAWMVRRTLFDAIAGYRTGPFPEDYDFFLRAAAQGARFAKVPEVLLHWREHDDRLSRISPRFGLEAFRACKAEALVPLLGGRPVSILGADRNGKRWSRLLRDLGTPTESYYAQRAGRVGQPIDRIPVRAAEDLPPPGNAIILSTIGRGREAVRRNLRTRGYKELTSFFCVQ